MATAVISTNEAREMLIAEEFGTGLQCWNLQAWIDFAMVKIMMGRVGDVIPKTYMPILRLVCDDPALLFKRKSDPRDSLDRTGFGGHKRITLEEEDFENGPAATLQTILSYLKHFEGWHAQTPHSKPPSGDEK